MPPVGFWEKDLLFRKSRTAVHAKMLHVDAEAVMSWILMDMESILKMDSGLQFPQAY